MEKLTAAYFPIEIQDCKASGLFETGALVSCTSYNCYRKFTINPYHAKGYLQLVTTSTKHDYSCNCSKCSSMPSRTIVLY